MERVKKPHNYGLTAEEEELAKYKELFEKEKREREEREERERDEQESENERMKKQKKWTVKLDQVKHEQHKILDTQSLPLRNYLMVHVMPTLTKALIGILINKIYKYFLRSFLFIECCQVQPDDPVDFVVSLDL
jgi:adenylate kinase